MERSLYERQNKLSSLEQMLADEREQAAHQINNKNREIQQNKDQELALKSKLTTLQTELDLAEGNLR
jgi:hypothetical protein